MDDFVVGLGGFVSFCGPSSPVLLPEKKGVRVWGINYIDTDLSRPSGRYRPIPDALLLRARELRTQQTSTEQFLWIFLRGRRLRGAEFRRQHNTGQFIAAFYCYEARLVIELDGEIHQTQQTQDKARDDWMIACGLKVLRFKNEAVATELDKVLEEICTCLPERTLSPGPLLPSEARG